MALKIITVLVGACAAVFLGSPLVGAMFRCAARSAKVAEAHDQTSDVVNSQLRGGRWIGYLERLAIYSAILSSFPGAIAVALAIKGLGRYPELRGADELTAERFIIGTFTSMLWACGVAGLTRWLLMVL